MYPTLVVFGPVEIRTASFFTALAFLMTAFVFWRKTREEHYHQEQAFDAFLLSIAMGLLASRIGFILLHFSELGRNFWAWFDVVGRAGGSVFFGLMGASIYLYRHAARQKWDQFEVLDFWFLAVAAGMVLRQLGNFLAGVGFGYETNLPWGVVFPSVFTKHHPAQLYWGLFFLVLYFYLSWAEYHYRTFLWYRAGKKTAHTGFLSCVFIISSGFVGALMQFFTPAQVIFRGINIDLGVYLLLVLGGGVMLYLKSGRSFLPKKTTTHDVD